MKLLNSIKIKRLFLALVSGCLIFLSFPDFSFYPLIFVSLIPFFALLDGCSKKGAFFYGLITGTVAHAGVFHWIAYTARAMSDFSMPLSIVTLILFSTASGLSYAFSALFIKMTERSFRQFSLVLAPAIFVSIEHFFPYLFPWYIGNCLYRFIPLIQISDLAGVSGISFLVVLTGKLSFDVIKEPKRIKPIMILAGVYLFVFLYGFFRMEQNSENGKTLKMAVIQPDITLEEKKNMVVETRIRIYNRLEELLGTIKPGEEDLIILPEGAFPFFFMPKGHELPGFKNPIIYTEKYLKIANELKTPVISGTLRKPVNKVRNSAVLMRTDGSYEIFDKMKLLAFGEHIPLSDTFPFLKDLIKRASDLETGSMPAIFSIDGKFLHISICYEATMPSYTREQVVSGSASMIVNLTNDVWFGPGSEPEQHLMVQVFRAVELRIPLVRATGTGISAFVDSYGRITKRMETGERGILRENVLLRDSFSFYRAAGDVFIYLCVLFFLAALLFPVIKRIKQKK